MTLLYRALDGTEFHTTDGWSIERNGANIILSRQVGGDLPEGGIDNKQRGAILNASQMGIRAIYEQRTRRGNGHCG